MTTQLTREQLDSITPATVRAFKAVKRILAARGWPCNALEVKDILREAIAAHEVAGVRGKRLERLIDDLLALRGLS